MAEEHSLRLWCDESRYRRATRDGSATYLLSAAPDPVGPRHVALDVYEGVCDAAVAIATTLETLAAQ